MLLNSLIRISFSFVISNLTFATSNQEHFNEVFEKCMLYGNNPDVRMKNYCNCTAQKVIDKYNNAKTEIDRLYISLDKASTLRINDLCLNEYFSEPTEIFSIFLLKVDQYLATYISNKTNEYTPQGIQKVIDSSKYGFIQYCINHTILNRCNKIASLEFSYNCINNVFKEEWSDLQNKCINLSKNHSDNDFLKYLDENL